MTQTPRNRIFIVAAVDGGGGLFVAWEDYSRQDVYAQHLLADGTRALGWPADGIDLCPGDKQYQPQIVSDDSGGAIITWTDKRSAPTGDYHAYDMYGTRITSSGQIAPGWNPAGTPICTAPGGQATGQILPDGMGGAIQMLVDTRTAPSVPDPIQYYDIYAQHITGEGTIAPGWPPVNQGLPICAAANTQIGDYCVSDGVGGVLIVWTDYRNVISTSSDIYAQRIMANGTIAPGWPVNGAPACNAAGYQFENGVANVYHSGVASDGMEGLFVVYENYFGGFSHAYVQHLTGTGFRAPGWPAEGLPLAPIPFSADQKLPVITSAGFGGAVAAWEDYRLGGSSTIFVQRVTSDGPVPVEVALASAEAQPNMVRLIWQLAGGLVTQARVERRMSQSAWENLGVAESFGADRLRYEDRTVAPGSRYVYRLVYRDAGSEVFGAESWVDVPLAYRFSLAGARPNPVVDELSISFSLASAEMATVELYDVRGRRVFHDELRGIGPGQHFRRLDVGARLAAGMYWLRLTQGAERATTKVIVAR